MDIDFEKPLHLLKLKDVKEKTSLGTTTIYRRMDAGTFPMPRRLSPGCVRWIGSDVDEWIATLPIKDRNS